MLIGKPRWLPTQEKFKNRTLWEMREMFNRFPLYCLPFFNLRPLNTSLISSNFSSTDYLCGFIRFNYICEKNYPHWHINSVYQKKKKKKTCTALMTGYNSLSISGRSLQDKWRHRHLNSRDGAFQNGDRFQVLTDFNGREDTMIIIILLIGEGKKYSKWLYMTWSKSRCVSTKLIIVIDNTTGACVESKNMLAMYLKYHKAVLAPTTPACHFNRYFPCQIVDRTQIAY